MKQSYIRPTATAIKLAAEEAFLAGSTFSTDGSGNTQITPSDNEEFGGEFQSNNRGWSSDNWE